MRSRALVQALATAALAAAGGCRFDAPAYDGTRYACAPPDERCPPGHVCVDGFCASGEGPPGDVDAAPVNTSTMRVEVAYDTSILSDATTQNGAALEFLEMDAAPRRVALVQLDLAGLPADATVVAAELHVTIFDPLESGTFQLFPLTESWSEAGATWDEREPGVPWSGGLSVPTLDANALLGEFAPRVAGDAVAALDAALVQGWLTAPGTNYGFAVVSTSPDGRGGQMRSSEYAAAPAERPYVLVMVAAP
ncbi:MAG TPA: DNRLRE domain-containing protein [Kofleriaceae bacterium]|nr:DNRLRE domain-containing protein [Kofleriaceae bacterium]